MARYGRGRYGRLTAARSIAIAGAIALSALTATGGRALAVTLVPLTVNIAALQPSGSGTIASRDGKVHCVMTSGNVSGDCHEDY